MAGQQAADCYFSSYGDLGVHKLMLEDRPRTTSYRKFFEMHRDFVKGKVVMDVGAGTGILSLFAATAGAKKVYAVEASEVATLCEEIVKENGFESIIEVIHGAVEDITLPEDVCVDIIVSEWMGFYLLHESMLDSVLVARDKFLAPDGILVPSRACLYLAPVDMSEHFQDRADHWSNIYGYDFSPIASTFNIQEVSKPLIKTLDTSVVKAEAEKLLDLDLKSTTLEDVKSFAKLCKFPMTDESRIHGFAAWFDIDFDLPVSVNDDKLCEGEKCVVMASSNCELVNSKGDASNHGDKSNCGDSSSPNAGGDSLESKEPSGSTPACSSSSSVRLSTGPSSPPTHWKQTVIFLPQTIMVIEDIVLCCKVQMSQDGGNKRHYNISIELLDESCLCGDDDCEEFSMEDNDDNDDSDLSDGARSDDSRDHPVPCDCGSNRCRLISALVEKYGSEHEKLEQEAEMIETEAEKEAAKVIDTAIETEGWTLDTSDTDPTAAQK